MDGLCRANRVHKKSSEQRRSLSFCCKRLKCILWNCGECTLVYFGRYISRDPFNSTEVNEDGMILISRSCYDAGAYTKTTRKFSSRGGASLYSKLRHPSA